MDMKHLVCLVLSHRWKPQHLDGQTVVLVCRRCGKVEPPAAHPMGGGLAGNGGGAPRVGGI